MKAAEGRIDPLIGREDELEQHIHVLARPKKQPIVYRRFGRWKNGPCGGVGQTDFDGNVPELLKQTRIYSLDLGALLAEPDIEI